MQTVKVTIEKTKNHYSAYAENAEGVYGGGNTVEEAKQSILDAIRLLKEHNKPEHVPAILRGEYKLVYKFDAESFFKYYKKIFTNSGLENITGINQRQLQHYSTGLKKPRPAQRKKIETALHNLGNELLSIEL
jgi:predicted RNase H-like HicB family nuclease